MTSERNPLAFMGTMQSFEDWYTTLEMLASDHGVSVADADAWRESYEQGADPWSALLDEYPDLESDESDATSRWDVQAVAAAIEMPITEWPGNCYAVACKVLAAGLLIGRAVYGHYLGPIRPGTMFHGKPIVHHGWIETPDGRIVDPTRWVFMGAAPYIHEATSPCPDYDEGGNVWLLSRQRPAPEHDPGSDSVEMPTAFRPLASSLLSRQQVQSRLTTMEAHWLATLSLIALGDRAKPLYEALVALGFAALIPIDNRRKVLG
jgi:hypothetical protein